MGRIAKPGPHAGNHKPKQKFRPKPKVMVPRLPPGATKTHHWNGAKWYGTLKVLNAPEFTASSGNEQTNLWALDRMYREWLAKQTDDVKARHMAHLK